MMKVVIISLNSILIILLITCGCTTMETQNLNALSSSHNPEFTAIWFAALNETGIVNATARIIDLGYIIEKDSIVKELYFSFIGNNGQEDRWYFVSRDAYGKFSVEDRGKIDYPDRGPHPLAIFREIDRLDLSQTPFKDANISIRLDNGANVGFNNYSVPKIYKVENGVLSPIGEIKFP